MISKYKKLFNWSCVYCMSTVGEKKNIFGIISVTKLEKLSIHN